MSKIVLNKLQQNNKIELVEQEGQWYLGTKKVIIVHSEPIHRIFDGSSNGLELKAIGKYTLQIEEISCIYVFTLLNGSNCQIEHVIVPQPELLKRLHAPNQVQGKTYLKFWLTDNSQLMESYGCGAEGEFMALWIDPNRDFTQFLNNWTIAE